jgi:hypothetical protein
MKHLFFLITAALTILASVSFGQSNTTDEIIEIYKDPRVLTR